MDLAAVLAAVRALVADWFWSCAGAGRGRLPAAVRPDPGGPAYGTLLLSRLPLEAVEQLPFPPAGGREQRTALVATIWVAGRTVTVAAAHLSNKQGHNVHQCGPAAPGWSRLLSATTVPWCRPRRGGALTG